MCADEPQGRSSGVSRDACLLTPPEPFDEVRPQSCKPTRDQYDERSLAEPCMQSIISIKDLTKTYASGFEALKRTNLEIRRGEIFALLGPNGAGKTTLINIVCGIVNASGGTIEVDGHDIRKN